MYFPLSYVYITVLRMGRPMQPDGAHEIEAARKKKRNKKKKIKK